MAPLPMGWMVIVIAHRLATLQRADQILVLDAGQLVQQGKHADLIAQAGLYQRFWHERERARGWKLGADGDGVGDQGSGIRHRRPGSSRREAEMRACGLDFHATLLPNAVMKKDFLGEPDSPRPT
jgi:ABC-type multidrug transport system ATPase subunit